MTRLSAIVSRGGASSSACALGHAEAALVERLAGDHAGQVQQPQVAQRAQVVERADAAGPDEAAAHRVGDAPHLVDVHALEHPVACRRWCRRSGARPGAGAGRSAPRGASGSRASSPDTDTLPAADVHGHQHAQRPRWRSPPRGTRRRRTRRCPPPPAPRPADSALRIDSSERRPPPYCTGTPASRVIRSQVVEVGGLALAGAVEVHHVQVARARLHERARGLQRVVRVHGLLVEVALAQPHGLAVADVHRRQQDHAGTAQSAAKLAQQPQAVRPGLLRVELRSEHVRPRHHARELRAVHRGAEHVLLVRGARGEGVHVVEGARVGQPSASRDSRRQATWFQPMCGTFRPGASSASTPPSSRPMPSAPPCSVVLSNSSCMPMQMPMIGTPASRRSRSSSSKPELAHRLHRLRHRADAGQHDARGRAHRVVVARDRRPRTPTCSKAFSTERRLPMP